MDVPLEAKDAYQVLAVVFPRRRSVIVHTELSKKRLATLSKLAVQAYDACGCRSMARVDFIATARSFYALEVNTVPGMTATSLVPKSASKLGYSFEEIVKLIADSASLDHARSDKNES